MAVSSNRQKYVFGTGAVIFYERTSAGTIGKRIAGITDGLLSAEFSDDVEIVQAEPGGASRYSQDAQYGAGEAMLSISFNKLPLGLLEALKGVAVTEASADASGSVSSTLTNTIGTSLSADITGAAATSGSESDIPLGRVVIRAVSTTTVDVLTEESDVPVLSGITIATGANVLSGIGITLTGDSTIAFTTGDEAYIDCRPANSERTTFSHIGNEVPLEVAIALHAQELTSGQITRLFIKKALCSSLPFALTAKEHMTTELEFTVLRPSSGSMYELEMETKA